MQYLGRVANDLRTNQDILVGCNYAMCDKGTCLPHALAFAIQCEQAMKCTNGVKQGIEGANVNVTHIKRLCCSLTMHHG